MDDQEDSALSAVVARADALMQRRRQPASNPPESEDLPVLTEAVDLDMDIPLLTEEAEVSETGIAAPAQEPLDVAVLDILAQELARRMNERLAVEIPDLVASALQSTLTELTQELQQGLAKSAEDAIRDFLAEREKLDKIQARS